ncbi:beta-lactamase [Agrobacterium sp. SHOUNA12C]|uniref:Beta-lactamase n=1 Tax=Rhizobium rhizogenes NBRC 13257 TaxID=1220581 RepID=A0AA87QE54_RHIRH|nr:class C beta-lactamase [Rhizobium rhizogenes]MCJ9725535.1 beta-lactamase [Agrobacterium sp. BETTINA12B]MCJ9761399.1 beta-lactamase [Agrobacterium sp. SHOUNA12C]NTF55938.1 beta-lactamase [Rhizobium rhizogenes]NTF75518.1 beta-lactamase [Rhizobium rhizogenes]NTF94546.1 beta-lactamase [Rhizobium rhizogenes]
MRNLFLPTFGMIAVASLFHGSSACAADGGEQARLERAVNEAIRPVMKENDIPGMAVAVTVNGKRYVFNYGVASRENGQKVTEDTIFELGSISKTFTATLASYAQLRGTLSFSDKASKYLPALAGSSFDTINLLDLGTYTAGGLPLQFPDDVTGQDKMIAYYKNWRPDHAPGTRRLYSNPSIGLFGYLAAASMGEPFDALMEQKIFPGLGLTHTYIRVPQDQMGNYAYGYSKSNKPIRVGPGALDSEAYGVKTTAADMIHFLEANMDSSKLDETLQSAIATTHTGYYRIGDMTQGLGWEMYAYPTSLERLQAGNSNEMSRNPNKANKLVPPQPPRRDVLINKTGSTNGFGAYVAFAPAKGIGIVMLANRNYPIPARIKAAYRILTALDKESGMR